MTQPKARADLKFEKTNMPEPCEMDYTEPVTDKDCELMEKAMRFKSGLGKDELERVLEDGILISGEPW